MTKNGLRFAAGTDHTPDDRSGRMTQRSEGTARQPAGVSSERASRAELECENVDRRQIDFSDVVSGRLMPPVYPSEVLRDEFLKPMQLSVYRLAHETGVSRPRLNDVVLGRSAASGALSRDDIGILNRPSGSLRLGRRRAHAAPQD